MLFQTEEPTSEENEDKADEKPEGENTEAEKEEETVGEPEEAQNGASNEEVRLGFEILEKLLQCY